MKLTESNNNSVFSGTKLPCLDGWRGVSILAVLMGHGWQVPGYPHFLKPLSWGAAPGVECFFVISGYLITTLLLRELKKYQSISLTRFYERRALRLFPAYFGFVVVIAILCLTPFNLSEQGWYGLLTFSANVYPGNESTVHFWSLAVEQQFYLIWPLTLVILSKRSSVQRHNRFALALLVPLVLCPLCRILTDTTSGGGWLGRYSFLKQADILAWGCLLALITHHYAGACETFIRRRPGAVLAIAVLLIASSQVLLLKRFSDSSLASFRCTISGAGFASIIAWSMVFKDSIIGKVLERGPLPWLGLISYSVYVWHMLFFTKPSTFGLSWAPWGNFTGFFVFSVLAGWISWKVLEKPFFTLRRSLHSHKPTQGAAPE